MTVPMLGLVNTIVMCVGCGTIHEKMLESVYVNDKTARRVNSYLPVLCNGCKQELDKNRLGGGS